MSVLTQAVAAAALFLGMPSEPSSQPDAAARTSNAGPAAEVASISVRRMTVQGRDYAWTVVVPRGVETGGPALLFLHGYGECGEDGLRQLGVGLPPAMLRAASEWPFVLIAPQKPVFDSEWEDHERAVLAMLDAAAEEGLYDPDRLVISGLSQGGHGTIWFAANHPDRFKAAAPVCGYVDRRFSDQGVRIAESGATPEDPGVVETASKLAAMPLWLFHGGRDNVVPLDESRSLFAALGGEPAGDDAPPGRVRFTEFPQADHNSWDAGYAEPELAAWLLRHAR